MYLCKYFCQYFLGFWNFVLLDWDSSTHARDSMDANSVNVDQRERKKEKALSIVVDTLKQIKVVGVGDF